jgi:hypothetical protein
LSFVNNVTERTRDREQRSATVRRISANKVREVFARWKGHPEIVVTLALGEACPFSMWWEKEIWLDEIRKADEVAIHA